MGKFKDDLNIGQKYEEIILKRAKKTYPLAYIQKGKFKYWDINVPEVNITLEVKYDKTSIHHYELAIIPSSEFTSADIIT